jgi:hypothetical protein
MEGCKLQPSAYSPGTRAKIRKFGQFTERRVFSCFCKPFESVMSLDLLMVSVRCPMNLSLCRGL